MRYYLDYNASMDERVKSYVKEVMDMHGNLLQFIQKAGN